MNEEKEQVRNEIEAKLSEMEELIKEKKHQLQSEKECLEKMNQSRSSIQQKALTLYMWIYLSILVKLSIITIKSIK